MLSSTSRIPRFWDLIGGLAREFEAAPELYRELRALEKSAQLTTTERGKSSERMTLSEDHVDRGDFEAAIVLLEKVLAYDPQHGPAKRAVIYCMIKTGRLSEAEHRLQLALAAQPDDFVSATYLGWVLLLNDDKAGYKHLERAIELSPSNLAAWQVWASSYIKFGRLAELPALLARAEEALDQEDFEKLMSQLPPIQ